MKKLSQETVLEALKAVEEPELKKDIVSIGMVESVSLDGLKVDVVLRLTTPACPLKGELHRRVEAGIHAVFGEAIMVTTSFSKERLVPKADAFKDKKEFRDIGNVVLVGSGKGGVGKSTVAFNLALSLAETGASVGLLDGDLYGPSLPILAGIQGETLAMTADERIRPVEKFGLKMVSLGLVLKDTDAVLWRGPLLHKTIQQFFHDVDWGTLDYLIVDLPPGTGDIQLSIHQLVKVSGAVVVTTPQNLAFADVLRAVKMFEKLELPVYGLVENMSFFEADGKTHYPFGRGRIREYCNTHGIEHLGRIPILPAVAAASDAGTPLLGAANGDTRAYYDKIAGSLASKVSITAFQSKAEPKAEKKAS